MRSFDCFVRFLPVSDRRELNSYDFFKLNQIIQENQFLILSVSIKNLYHFSSFKKLTL